MFFATVFVPKSDIWQHGATWCQWNAPSFSKSKACCHSPHFSQALKAALQLITCVDYKLCSTFKASGQHPAFFRSETIFPLWFYEFCMLLLAPHLVIVTDPYRNHPGSTEKRWSPQLNSPSRWAGCRLPARFDITVDDGTVTLSSIWTAACIWSHACRGWKHKNYLKNYVKSVKYPGWRESNGTVTCHTFYAMSWASGRNLEHIHGRCQTVQPRNEQLYQHW